MVNSRDPFSVDNSPNELRELLFKEGDHGGGVAGGEFTNSTLGITLQNSRPVKQGSVALPGDGQVTGFIFANEADAKRTYEALAAQIGRGGKIATGLGESSWGTRTTENNKNDVVFRRDNFVVFIRAQSKNHAELNKRAKAVDVRIKKHIASGK